MQFQNAYQGYGRLEHPEVLIKKFVQKKPVLTQHAEALEGKTGKTVAPYIKRIVSKHA